MPPFCTMTFVKSNNIDLDYALCTSTWVVINTHKPKLFNPYSGHMYKGSVKKVITMILIFEQGSWA